MRLHVLIVLMLLVVSTAQATTYWLNPATGADSNPGTQGSPWQTLNRANTQLGPGDTLNIQGGTYTPNQYAGGSWVSWSARGAAGQPITIQAAPGATVIFEGQQRNWWLAFDRGLDYYVVIQQLEFQHFMPGTITINKGGYVAVLHCVCRDTYDDTSSCMGTGGGDALAHHVIFRDNRFVNIGDPTVYGVRGAPGDHALYIAENSHHIVMDGNQFDKTWGFAVHLFGHGRLDAPIHHVITRFNTIRNTRERAVIVTGTTYANIYTYNNTITNEAQGLFRALGSVDGYDGGAGVSFHLGSQYNGPIIVKNNLATGTYTEGAFFADNPIMGSGQLQMDYNLWTNSAGAPYLWGSDHLAQASFAARTGLDHHGRSSDPVDHGTWLTLTTSAGSGTRLPVRDAGYFTEGYGLVPGDVIQLQGSTATAQVLMVDEGAQSLTLDRRLTWSADQGVALRYGGAAPDIGAAEWRGNRLPTRPRPYDFQVLVQ